MCRYFGQLSQKGHGSVASKASRHTLGVGSLSQQDWDTCAESTLSKVDVKVVDTWAMYDFVKFFKGHFDPKFQGAVCFAFAYKFMRHLNLCRVWPGFTGQSDAVVSRPCNNYVARRRAEVIGKRH